MNMPFGAGMAGAQVELCAALAKLRKEHDSLREKMTAYQQLALHLQNDTSANLLTQIQAIAEKVQAFADELHPHSDREEMFLFPVMANYIGREFGPIAVMEQEHQQGKLNLNQFKNGVRALGDDVTFEQAQKVVHFALEAYNILRDHFMKEDTVLFPMAERMLSAAEKATLLQQIS